MLDKEVVRGKKKIDNIVRARDRKDSEDLQSSVHLGYQLFPASICVLTPSRRGFVLVWQLCVVHAHNLF